MRRRRNISASELGLRPSSGRERDLFRWFLACLLFGKPIQQGVAARAYRELLRSGFSTPETIVKAGWDRLVAALDRGHYLRYDYSTATKLLEVISILKEQYGSVRNLIRSAKNKKDLRDKLLEFRGVGPVTADIFLREVRLGPSMK